jgi:hypothetical protein
MSFIGIDDNDELGFEALPAAFFVSLALLVVAYLTLVEYGKQVLQPPTGCRGCSPPATGSPCAPPGGALESCRCGIRLGPAAARPHSCATGSRRTAVTLYWGVCVRGSCRGPVSRLRNVAGSLNVANSSPVRTLVVTAAGSTALP